MVGVIVIRKCDTERENKNGGEIFTQFFFSGEPTTEETYKRVRRPLKNKGGKNNVDLKYKAFSDNVP